MEINFKNKSVVITGGAGFIGSHLAKKVRDLGGKVIVIDKKLDKYSLLNNFLGDKNIQFVKKDITKRKDITSYIQSIKPDYIYHLAAVTIVEEALEDPYRTFETNVMGTVNILEAARSLSKLKAVIVASSDKAYGKLTKSEYQETDALMGDHPYDVSKSATDLISLSYHQTYNLPIVVTRFGNVYGEGDLNKSRIIPGICESLLKNKTLHIRSDGKYVRDYLYVEDVVNGYILLAEKINTTKGHAYNFSSNDTLSVLDLLFIAEKVLHVKIPYKILNTAKNEIPYQHLNDQKVRKLGWEPVFSVEKVLPQIFKWFKETY